MRINDVLRGKPGSDVVTINPDASVRDLVAMLAEHNVGALDRQRRRHRGRRHRLRARRRTPAARRRRTSSRATVGSIMTGVGATPARAPHWSTT